MKKKYILTHDERNEVLDMIRTRNTLAARNFLLGLPELKEPKVIPSKSEAAKVILEETKNTVEVKNDTSI